MEYNYKLCKETAKSITTIEFNGHEVHTLNFNKKSGTTHEKWEGLGRYSLTQIGFIHQLELMEYVEVDDGS